MGTIVVGKIESGKIKKGQSVLIMPNKVCSLSLNENFADLVFILTTCDDVQRVSEISAIYSETEDEVEHAMCGDNVRLRLKGVEEDVRLTVKLETSSKERFCAHSKICEFLLQEIQNGFVICNVKKPVRTTNVFEAQLAILEHKNIICAGYTAVLHVHTGIEEITLAVSH